jgi:hypothetical protein
MLPNALVRLVVSDIAVTAVEVVIAVFKMSVALARVAEAVRVLRLATCGSGLVSTPRSTVIVHCILTHNVEFAAVNVIVAREVEE